MLCYLQRQPNVCVSTPNFYISNIVVERLYYGGTNLTED